MDFFRTQLDRITRILANTAMDPKPTPIEKPWNTHDANLALYSALTQPGSPTTTSRHGKRVIRPALPTEIVLQILEHPTRWVLTSVVSMKCTGAQSIQVSSYRSPLAVLSSKPLSAEDAKDIRKAIFEFKGQDQGWSSYPADHGTYNNTWTWYEAVVRNTQGEEGQPPVEMCRFELQRNRHAGHQPESYRIEIGRDHPLIKGLGEGDVIDLGACAVFPGWLCQVHEAKIEMWGVDDLTRGGNMKWIEYREQDAQKENLNGHWMDRALAHETRAHITQASLEAMEIEGTPTDEAVVRNS